MLIIPAIDLLDGKCVRLQQGSYDAVTEYGSDPVEVARSFEAAGAEMIHVVDLSGARAGSPVHLDVLRAMATVTSLEIEYSGGLRSLEDVAEVIGAGASRVVLGTMVVEQPDEASKIMERFGPERVVAGVDVRDGTVATRGWETSSGMDVDSMIVRLRALGFENVVVTDITRDGMLAGVNVALVETFVRNGFSTVASGGVRDYGDIVRLKKVGAWGMITGKALYEGRFDLNEALGIARTESALAKRVIPCLDIKDGKVVKGKHFKDLQVVGDPVEMAREYDRMGADELTLLDIAATEEGRKNRADLVREVARAVRVPFTIGGGISSIGDIRDLLEAGADKVCVGSAAITDPGFISRAVQAFGSQCIVLSLDAKREGDSWEAYIGGGKIRTEKDAITFAREIEQAGIGEILVNSLDRDGTRDGFDVLLLKAVTDAVNVPVIASSGAGDLRHFADAIRQSDVDAVLAASLFHNGEFTIHDVKSYLSSYGIPVRI